MLVNVRTFSRNPSRYIQRARGGEEVVVMFRNVPAVRLVPIEEVVSAEEQLRRLGLIPGVKVARGKPPLPPTRSTLSGEGPMGSEMVLEDRK